MKKIIPAMDELKRALIGMKLAEAFLDASVVFFLSYLFFLLFAVPSLWALLVFILTLVYMTNKKLRTVNLKEVEKKVPELTDQLRAAHDTMYKEAPLVDSLHDDVVKLMRQIKTSYFVDFKKLWRELVVSGILAFAVILVASLHVQLLDYQVVLDDFSSLARAGQYGLDLSDKRGTEGANTDIFGNESIAELGLEELNLEVSSVFSELNLGDIRDVRDQEFKEKSFAQEIAAGQSACGEECNEDFPSEHKEIVKRYFSQIATE